jgi:hypothetical protein
VSRIPRASRLPVADVARGRSMARFRSRGRLRQWTCKWACKEICKDCARTAGLLPARRRANPTRVERAKAPRCPPIAEIPVGGCDGSGTRRRPRTRGATHRRVSQSLAQRAKSTRTSPHGWSSIPRRVRTSRWQGLSRRSVSSTPLVLTRGSTAECQRPTRWTARHEIPCALERNALPTRRAASGTPVSFVSVSSSDSTGFVGYAAAARTRCRTARWLWHSTGMQGCGRVVASLLLHVSVARRVGAPWRGAADGRVGGCDPCR